MSESSQVPQLDRIELAADLVSAYVSNNSLPSAELPALITQVYAALLGLSAPQAAEEEEVERATPAQIKKSITPDALISFIDGKPYKTLKRHLTTHGLDIEGYRRRYGLPADYPTVSANYSAARSALAKDLGLGQQRRKPSAKAAEPVDEVVAEAPAEPRRKSGTSGEGRKPGGRRKAAA
ncbi:MucR family transcriptional regulator [Methylorubrum zatmanii]|uniref:MucR family transcriptional regulator n=1 Tax=Methylorubrum zatmanii TaxID=29429 RepID=A0ABW1WVF2_9HYPH|nr:MucR family transcriptional regulator [Methylorubrum zatmanii]MBD8908742.1 MucR family transcriptional regulator [Methylorubrum zatmanii]